MENEGLLQKECNVFDNDGLLVEQYRTRLSIVPVGQYAPNNNGRVSTSAPALYRSFTYDAAGNRVAGLPQMKEWSVACENAAQGFYQDDDGVVVNISKSSTRYLYNEISSVPIGSTQTLFTKQLQPDEYIMLRHVAVGGDCIARFQVLINGTPIGTKRTWWTKWDTDFWFSTSNGGIIYQNEELIEVRVTNLGEHFGDFEASVGIV